MWNETLKFLQACIVQILQMDMSSAGQFFWNSPNFFLSREQNSSNKEHVSLFK